MQQTPSFHILLEKRWDQKKYICIGLDPVYTKLPNHLQALTTQAAFFAFNKALIDTTHEYALAYKPQIAYYSAEGESGLRALSQTISYIKATYPDIPVILDAKRGDIGSTAEAYVREVFDVFGADAVTLNPYLGFDAIEPFLKRQDKGCILLCRTSNPGASDFQDLLSESKPLYMHVAEKVQTWHTTYKNCLLVVGATWPEQMREIRKVAPDMWFLVPGIGAQGGDLQKVLEYGLTNRKSGIIISASRSIIYASREKDFAEKAGEETRKINSEIAQYV